MIGQEGIAPGVWKDEPDEQGYQVQSRRVWCDGLFGPQAMTEFRHKRLGYFGRWQDGLPPEEE